MAVRKIRREIGIWPSNKKAVFFQSSPDGVMYTIDIAGLTKDTLPPKLRGKFQDEKAARSAFDKAVVEHRLKHPKIAKREPEPESAQKSL